MDIHKRKIFDKISPYIGDDTVIVLHGARQVGKSYILFFIRDWLTARQKKIFFYDLEYPDILADFNNGPDIFLSDLRGKGYIEDEEVYVLIDEIQYLDDPSSFMKVIIDHHKNIHLIVSGSSSFDIKTKFSDSLTGRTTPFEIFPLSFEEFLLFKQTGYNLPAVSSPSQIKRLQELYKEFVRYGGYPRVVLESAEEKKRSYLSQVIDTYVLKDVRDIAQVEDVRKFNNLLYVLAAQSGQLLDMTSLSRETNISFPTLKKYLTVLEETYVIKRVHPYSKSPNVEISKNPKIFFYDSGLQTLLWFKSFQHTILGSVLETNIFGELVKQFGRQSIHYWRTKQRQEIDFVIEKAPNYLLPIEVKTNFQSFKKGAIESFTKRYHLEDWKVIAIEGKKQNNSYVFPWEL